MDGPASCLLTGTEMAHWLFCTKNTHGARYTDAKLHASCTSPVLVAPSPTNATVTESSPSRCAAIAAPTACSPWVPIGIAIGAQRFAVNPSPPCQLPRHTAA